MAAERRAGLQPLRRRLRALYLRFVWTRARKARETLAQMQRFAGRPRDRSLSILLRHLTPAQRRQFNWSCEFTVQGASGRRYRITYGTVANIIVEAERAGEDQRLCAAPEHLSAPAVMLAQKLMLESREEEFLRVAIVHPSPHARRWRAGRWTLLAG